MKAYITTCVPLDSKGIDEIKELVPELELVITQTTKTIQPAWNPLFAEMQGDFKWLRTLMPNDGDMRCYITSADDLKKKSITTHLGLYDNSDTDDILDFYFGIPDKIDTRAKKNGFKTNLAWLFIHEMLHGMELWDGYKDATHTMEEQGRLKELLTIHLTRRQEQKEKITLLQRIVELTQILFSLKKKTSIIVSKPTDLLPLVKRQASAVVSAMAILGHPVRIVEGYRSPERQTELYNQGRTTPGAIVTNAKAGESLHNYGCAIDFIFRYEGYNASEALWDILGKTAEKQGFEWGGDFVGFIDRPHCEMKLGYNLKDFQAGRVDYDKFN